MSTVAKQKGPATAATVPDHGSQSSPGSSNMTRNSTSPAGPTTEDILDAFRHLEGAMCDALLMADLASEVVTDALSDRGSHQSITGKEDLVYMPALRGERLIFATSQAWRMVRDLRDAYYAALEGRAAS